MNSAFVDRTCKLAYRSGWSERIALFSGLTVLVDLYAVLPIMPNGSSHVQPMHYDLEVSTKSAGGNSGMNNSLVASVSKFSNGTLVLRVLGDLDIDIELIARQIGVNNVASKSLKSSSSGATSETELQLDIDNPLPLLTQIHDYLNSIGYQMNDDILGSSASH